MTSFFVAIAGTESQINWIEYLFNEFIILSFQRYAALWNHILFQLSANVSISLQPPKSLQLSRTSSNSFNPGSNSYRPALKQLLMLCWEFIRSRISRIEIDRFGEARSIELYPESSLMEL
jgi:hypothetical protein